MASPPRQAVDLPRLQGPKLSASAKERASDMNSRSPKSRHPRSSRKDREFEMLLRRAARVRASAHGSQRKRESSKTPVA